MEDTKERMYYKYGNPADPKIMRHIRRYDFSSKAIFEQKGQKPKILDFGCGSGYGSKLISEILPNSTIVAYDISEGAIKFAKENNAGTNIIFTNELNNKKNEYDVIILMDMIEHLPKKEQFETIKSLKIMNPKAIFIISTPLNDFNGLSPTNKYHISCFDKTHWNEFLGNFFKKTEHWIVDSDFFRLLGLNEPYGKVVSICKN